MPGGKAPRIVTREMVQNMRPGSVIVDVSVDQGGCVETIRPTTHSQPVYQLDGVIHYGVTNMPASVPYTSTQALCNVTLPYLLKLAGAGVAGAMRQDLSLASGLNTLKGQVTHPAVAESLELPFRPMN